MTRYKDALPNVPLSEASSRSEVNATCGNREDANIAWHELFDSTLGGCMSTVGRILLELGAVE